MIGSGSIEPGKLCHSTIHHQQGRLTMVRGLVLLLLFGFCCHRGCWNRLERMALPVGWLVGFHSLLSLRWLE